MRDMATVDLQYVQAFKDRHGRMRYYFRRRGYGLKALPSEPGTVAFAAAYESALNQAKPAATSVTEGPRSMGALIAEYYLSSDFKKLSPVSQKTYRGVLEPYRNSFGRDSVINFTRAHLTAIFHGMADTPAQASNLRKRLNTVFELGVDLGWIATNPCKATRRVKYKVTGFVPWTDLEIAAYRKRWPSGTRPRLALELLLGTGVRRSDVVSLGRQHVSGARIGTTQTKGGKRVMVTMPPELQAEIALAPKGMTFLVTHYGAPFTTKGFGKWFVAQAVAAGLTGRTAHGLRKALGRQTAEAGASDKEIAAQLGHSSTVTAAIYTKDADQVRLADQAAAKLAKAKRRT